MHTKETSETIGATNPMQEKHQMFESTWRAKWLADGAKTIEQMAEALEAEAMHLRELAAAGVELVDEVNDDYASLTTTDPDVAAKYEFQTVDDEDEEGNATIVGVGPLDKLGTGLAADLAAVWAVDGKVGILGHAESIEFVRPDVAERLMRGASLTPAFAEPAK